MTRNAHVPEPLRSLLNSISRNHADALEELHDTIASLNRSANMPKPTMTPATTTSKAHAPMPKPRSYDSKCEELAEAFLADHQPFTHTEKEDLAQTIQNAIEDWFFFRENPARGEDAQ